MESEPMRQPLWEPCSVSAWALVLRPLGLVLSLKSAVGSIVRAEHLKMHVCARACAGTHACMHACKRACVRACVHGRAHVRVCARQLALQKCVCVCVCVRVYACLHACLQACTHACVRVSECEHMHFCVHPRTCKCAKVRECGPYFGPYFPFVGCPISPLRAALVSLCGMPCKSDVVWTLLPFQGPYFGP